MATRKGRKIGVIFHHGQQTDGDGRPLELRIRKAFAWLDAQMATTGQKFGVHLLSIPGGLTRLSIIKNGPIPVYRAEVVIASSQAAVASGRHLWQPEGFVITPKTAQAELGFGLPKHDSDGNPINPPYGTIDGVFRECVINKFPGNKYLPAGYPAVVFAPLAFTEQAFDIPSVAAASGDIVQFMASARFEPNPDYPWEEPSQDQWFAHFVEEEPYADKALKTLFDMTNDLRASVGRDLLYQPTRGSYRPAAATINEAVTAGFIASGAAPPIDSNDYRDGYKSGLERLLKDGVNIQTSENATLQAGLAGLSPEDAGARLFDAIAADAGGNANMTSADWDLDADGWMPPGQSAAVGEGTVLDLATTPAGDGLAASQSFEKRRNWVYHGNYYWEGDAGRISWFSSESQDESNPYSMFRVSQNDPSIFRIPEVLVRYDARADGTDQFSRNTLKSGVCLHGRYYPIPGADWDRLTLSAALRRVNGRLFVLAVALDRADRQLLFLMVEPEKLQRFAIGETTPLEWDEWGRFDLSDAYNIGQVRFSRSAEKVLFRVERIGGVEALALNPDDMMAPAATFSSYESDHVPVRPLVAEYWEYAGGAFSKIETVGGVTLSNAHSPGPPRIHGFTASGTFTVAMDYDGNAIVRLRASVSDRSMHTGITPRYRTEDVYKRELVFPSGKRFVYFDQEIDQYPNGDDANTGGVWRGEIVSIDYIDIKRELVGGMRITYQMDAAPDASHLFPSVGAPSASVELFLGDEILDSAVISDPFPRLREFRQSSPYSSRDTHRLVWPDSIGYRYYYLISTIYSNPLQGSAALWYASPNGFIPSNSRGNTDANVFALLRTLPNGSVVSSRQDLHALEQQVDYGSKMLPLSDGFHSSDGYPTYSPGGTGTWPAASSREMRAWSIRGPGYRLYNPSPWFGGASIVHAFEYNGESLNGGHSLKNYFKCWGEPPLSFFTGEPPNGWPLSETAMERASLVGYRGTLDLGVLTGLDASLVNDIFPIGVI